MLVPPDIIELRSPNLRLWRAWEQIQMLESHIARWMNSGGYRFDRRTAEPGGTHDVREGSSRAMTTFPLGFWS